MTPQKVRQCLQYLSVTIAHLGDGTLHPERMVSHCMAGASSTATLRDTLAHLLWMTTEARTFPDDKIGKMNRWLGFVQGSLWAMGYVTIEQMKNLNMPLSGVDDGAAPVDPEP